MSATNSLTIVFEGNVRCDRRADGKHMQLHGQSRVDSGPPCDTDFVCQGASFPDLPEQLSDLSLREMGSPLQSPRQFELSSMQSRLQFPAHSVQVHRAVGARMFAALPAPPVPRLVRAAWWLLLSVLRIPGVGHLLLTTRGET